MEAMLGPGRLCLGYSSSTKNPSLRVSHRAATAAGGASRGAALGGAAAPAAVGAVRSGQAAARPQGKSEVKTSASFSIAGNGTLSFDSPKELLLNSSLCA